MEFQENILGLIGNTPLVKLNRLSRNVKAQVYREDGESESGILS